MLRTTAIAAGLLALAASTAHAQNLGAYGRTYEIKERDAIAVMKEAVRKKLANGGKQAMLKGAQDRYIASLNNVQTPAGIRPAKAPRTRLVDVSEVVKQTIRAPNGAIVAAAGTRINPLTIRPLTKKVFFIDGKDERQLKLVRDTAAAQDTIILLGGSVYRAGEYLKRRVYLDVPGLHTRMQVRALPSIVSQEGDKLKVVEVAP